ncbi:alpha/beta fold hydrolase [Streptomyces sp. NPDC101115]|uniref:alpha/beta fold hydrolase n=1 Tax=Streptomyces sp. NPDC101115 TaxID=3366106 RepID=UPI00382B98E4
MARAVVVHGVGQEYLGRRTLHGPVAAALADGVELAAGAGDVPASAVPAVEDVDVAFYGDAFRSAGAKSGRTAVRTVGDLTDPYEQELLLAMAEAAGGAGERRGPTKAPTPRVLQQAMNALLRSPFLPGPVAERFLLGVLRQVRRYFGEEKVRARALDAVASRVGPDTTVLVGHSLGSVVAYEALCAHPEWPVRHLVTLGSPLGMPSLVFDRLRPAPGDGPGRWPEGLTGWTNLADRHDVVASVKQLAPLFGTVGGGVPPRVPRDVPVDNGWKVHDLLRHLTARETGAAIGEGLRAG